MLFVILRGKGKEQACVFFTVIGIKGDRFCYFHERDSGFLHTFGIFL